ncbi:MAG: Triosephosphate isomerase [Parcubacteria group bacterium GW2011_GWC2_40_31]|nr:MAG: Triosephosphate isomerase [Parcubacteria group bacterium GW2011_GWF2_40_10]KKR47452.1 MAG: Triosephosphate isomerase [Parcubacteria group bacterium GW2011_GWA2_40_143]KKR59873.1 MAG: Triosephosphate isomerase [Parcubacteria group bacterium GW2011_GWC2_40_31]KKR81880.1 MAG: Triosephosphate isomerase [Parcubacteria group bacterium GW2011_GWD2_40_9]
MAKKIIIANWKMNPETGEKAKELFSLSRKAALKLKNTKVVICPPNIYFQSLGGLASKSGRISMGAQDVSIFSGSGPQTGEISAEMLKKIGVEYVILGHSSRRELGESGSDINKKIKNSLATGLKPILCVGEKERCDNGEFMKVVEAQLKESLDGLKSEKSLKNLIIAYEPVWAISKKGSFKADNPDSVFGMSIFIRKTLAAILGEDAVKKIPIIYGGSVASQTVKDFLERGGVNGLLVGGKSLVAKEFEEILKIADSSK